MSNTVIPAEWFDKVDFEILRLFQKHPAAMKRRGFRRDRLQQFVFDILPAQSATGPDRDKLLKFCDK
jgi:hypothetical protein